MIVVDASVWVSAFFIADSNHAVSRAWLEYAHEENEVLAAPFLMLVEVAGAISRNTHRSGDGMSAVARMMAVSTLRVIAVDRALALAAARLASAYFLRGADATYVAVAEYLGVPLVTWDQELLRRAQPVAQVVRPDFLCTAKP